MKLLCKVVGSKMGGCGSVQNIEFSAHMSTFSTILLLSSKLIQQLLGRAMGRFNEKLMKKITVI